ncbi:MAG: hydrolase [Eubacteriaceae bacterium]|nr:hydrolase [Eubacteriaceae bacterium]
MSKLLMNKSDTVAIAIDYQEKLVPAMKDSRVLESTTAKLIEGLRVLDIPVLVTQQYTKGLGETTDTIARALGDFTPIEKNTFSALKNDEFLKALQDTGAKSVIVFGIEAHICVQKTAIELIESGYNVFVATDCCSSRKKHDKKVAIERLAAAGAVITTYESVLFELLEGSKSEGFKEISKIIK